MPTVEATKYHIHMDDGYDGVEVVARSSHAYTNRDGFLHVGFWIEIHEVPTDGEYRRYMRLQGYRYDICMFNAHHNNTAGSTYQKADFVMGSDKSVHEHWSNLELYKKLEIVHEACNLSQGQAWLEHLVEVEWFNEAIDNIFNVLRSPLGQAIIGP